MCHEILKEEDDEVASLDENSTAAGGADICATQSDHLDELLDETNGNLTDKLTTLTLNDNAESVATASLNGNDTTASNDIERMDNANKSKKKTKKGSNSKAFDANDNKTDEDNSSLEANNASSSPSADMMKDDVINVNA